MDKDKCEKLYKKFEEKYDYLTAEDYTPGKELHPDEISKEQIKEYIKLAKNLREKCIDELKPDQKYRVRECLSSLKKSEKISD